MGLISPSPLQAIFKITLEVPSETVALSNMPVVEEKVNGLIKAVYFQETPIMSTYLVAVIVGMFDYVEAFTTDGTVTLSLSHYHTYFSFHLFVAHVLNLIGLVFILLSGTRVRVYTQVGKSAQGKFALEVAVKTLVLFKE